MRTEPQLGPRLAVFGASEQRRDARRRAPVVLPDRALEPLHDRFVDQSVVSRSRNAAATASATSTRSRSCTTALPHLRESRRHGRSALGRAQRHRRDHRVRRRGAKHEHGTVAGRVGQTGAGIDVDLPSRKAATNRRNAADLIELLHPPTGRVLSDRTGGSDKGEAPGEEISEKARGRIEERVETFGDLGGGVAHRARHARHETEPFEQHEDRNDGSAEPSGRPASGSTGTTRTSTPLRRHRAHHRR